MNRRVPWGTLSNQIPNFANKKNIYSVEEQFQTHFDAALQAYQYNDPYKSIRIFEFLKNNLGDRHSAFKYSVCNLAILYHKLGSHEIAIKYAKEASQYDETNTMTGFILGFTLYHTKQLYKSFMAFRDIRATRNPLYLQYAAEIDFNIAITFYKLGGEADIHFQNALDRIGIFNPDVLQKAKYKKYQTAKAAKGIDYHIEKGPLEEIRLFNMKGQLDPLPIKAIEPIRSPNIVLSPPSPLLSYYFTDPKDLAPSSVPLPPAHKIPQYMDHQMDYFSPSHFHKDESSLSPRSPGSGISPREVPPRSADRPRRPQFGRSQTEF